MPLQITGRHMTISDEQREYIDKKVNRLRRLCPKIDEMNFVLSKEKLLYQADATLRAGKVHAKATTSGAHLLEVIDTLVDKIEVQISKNKEKWDDRKKVGREKARTIPGSESEPPDTEDDSEED
jgi:putative sigma-54 modulation protein